jgi:hypothetical protein
LCRSEPQEYDAANSRPLKRTVPVLAFYLIDEPLGFCKVHSFGLSQRFNRLDLIALPHEVNRLLRRPICWLRFISEAKMLKEKGHLTL